MVGWEMGTWWLCSLGVRISPGRVPPLCVCEIVRNPDGRRVTITYSPSVTTTKNHILLFHIANSEISTVDLRQFPNQPWDERVDIVIRMGETVVPTARWDRSSDPSGSSSSGPDSIIGSCTPAGPGTRRNAITGRSDGGDWDGSSFSGCQSPNEEMRRQREMEEPVHKAIS
jgi:hypothetical protein